MVNWEILGNFFLVLVTIIYVVLTYKILKSHEKIEKIKVDPILWANPFGEDSLYIAKIKKYPAYNLFFELFIKFPEDKFFKKIVEYKLGSLINEEEDYGIDIDEVIEEYLKKIKRVNSNFVIKYVIGYYVGINKKPIKRADYLYYNSEEYEGEIMLGASTDKSDDFEGGKSPAKIKKFF